MTLSVQPIPVGARLVDTVEALTPETLAAMKSGGADGIVAYLGINLTSAVLAAADSLGLGICPVSPSRPNGWLPTATLGANDAATALRQLGALGVPLAGLVDWIDLEGAGADPTAYLDARAAPVVQAGLLAGLYVGAGGLLSGARLYALPQITRYWKSLSDVPEPDCGYCMVQLYPTTELAGVPVDYDFAQQDWHGRSATWLHA